MWVEKMYPPNIEAIAKVFGRKNLKFAVFTYAPTVYSPNGTNLPPHLVEHEQQHLDQQGDKPQEWWDRYLADPEFRLEQEIEAYQRQYAFSQKYMNRAERRKLLNKISKDLASPLYGSIISIERAKEVIKNE